MASFSSFSSSSSSSGSSKGEEDKNIVSFGSPFPKAIKKTPYKYLLNVEGEYDIYLDSSGYHWYIMVHYKVEGGELPKISFEVTCDKLSKGDLIPTMRVLVENDSDTKIVAKGCITATDVGANAANAANAVLFDGALAGARAGLVIGAQAGAVGGPVGIVLGAIIGIGVGIIGAGVVVGIAGAAAGGIQGVMLSMSGTKLRKVGTMTTTIMKLCETAEAVRVGMGNYNLITNNCQHFCNNVLEKLGLPTTPTSAGVVGTTTDVKENFDDIDQIFAIATDKDNECDGDTKG